MAFLIDGAAYFRAVREAVREARHSLFILGWDIDSRMRLVPQGARDGYPERLGDFLNAVVARRRGLRACVLSWDFADVYALEREVAAGLQARLAHALGVSRSAWMRVIRSAPRIIRKSSWSTTPSRS
jgi:phosphatidylserine/phosphatidylglycerophosphate/cardiolipin synthase-like enzyme